MNQRTRKTFIKSDFAQLPYGRGFIRLDLHADEDIPPELLEAAKRQQADHAKLMRKEALRSIEPGKRLSDEFQEIYCNTEPNDFFLGSIIKRISK